ncbi:MAG: hypothetical protein ACI9YM_000408 [Brevundimonas sp.]|jgi:hypothetical protein
MPVAIWIKISLSNYSRVIPLARRHQRLRFCHSGATAMLRLILALAITAPLLSGCIIIATDKPVTRVVQTAPADVPE